jgi:ribosomal 50S subunit-associated protein YjgA (DUF615 family)
LTNIKDRILQFAENQEGNKQVFFKKTGLKYGNFTGKSKNSDLGSKGIEEILSKYPDVDLEWLITGKEANKEEKEKTVMNEPPSNYSDSYKEMYIELLQENKELQKKVINLLEIKDSLKKYS